MRFRKRFKDLKHIMRIIAAFTIAYNTKDFNQFFEDYPAQFEIHSQQVEKTITIGLKTIDKFNITEFEYADLYLTLLKSRKMSNFEIDMLIEHFKTYYDMELQLNYEIIKILLRIQHNIDFLEHIESIMKLKLL